MASSRRYTRTPCAICSAPYGGCECPMCEECHEPLALLTHRADLCDARTLERREFWRTQDMNRHAREAGGLLHPINHALSATAWGQGWYLEHWIPLLAGLHLTSLTTIYPPRWSEDRWGWRSGVSLHWEERTDLGSTRSWAVRMVQHGNGNEFHGPRRILERVV